MGVVTDSNDKSGRDTDRTLCSTVQSQVVYLSGTDIKVYSNHVHIYRRIAWRVFVVNVNFDLAMMARPLSPPGARYVRSVDH